MKASRKCTETGRQVDTQTSTDSKGKERDGQKTDRQQEVRQKGRNTTEQIGRMTVNIDKPDQEWADF